MAEEMVAATVVARAIGPLAVVQSRRRKVSHGFSPHAELGPIPCDGRPRPPVLADGCTHRAPHDQKGGIVELTHHTTPIPTRTTRLSIRLSAAERGRLDGAASVTGLSPRRWPASPSPSPSPSWPRAATPSTAPSRSAATNPSTPRRRFRSPPAAPPASAA